MRDLLECFFPTLLGIVWGLSSIVVGTATNHELLISLVSGLALNILWIIFLYRDGGL